MALELGGWLPGFVLPGFRLVAILLVGQFSGKALAADDDTALHRAVDGHA
jgi:hypothetical protein